MTNDTTTSEVDSMLFEEYRNRVTGVTQPLSQWIEDYGVLYGDVVNSKERRAGFAAWAKTHLDSMGDLGKLSEELVENE